MPLVRTLFHTYNPDTKQHALRYCAELVAACLQAGGLMSQESKPGAATPQSLYRLYKSAGAVAANPCALRREFDTGQQSFASLFANVPSVSGRTAELAVAKLGPPRAVRSNSPPRVAFRQIASGRKQQSISHTTVGLSLSSLSIHGSTRPR